MPFVAATAPPGSSIPDVGGWPGEIAEAAEPQIATGLSFLDRYPGPRTGPAALSRPYDRHDHVTHITAESVSDDP